MLNIPIGDTEGTAKINIDIMGMSLRDYFAAKVLAAFITEPVEGVKYCTAFNLSDELTAAFASSAYRFADAMLRAREVK
jgi:hypothetical protein